MQLMTNLTRLGPASNAGQRRNSRVYIILQPAFPGEMLHEISAAFPSALEMEMPVAISIKTGDLKRRSR